MVGLFLFHEEAPLPHIPVFCMIMKLLFCTVGLVPLIIGKPFPLLCSEASAPFVIVLS